MNEKDPWAHFESYDEWREHRRAVRIQTVVATTLLLAVLGAVGSSLAFMAYVALG